jgi:transcriptional regulator with XRE-family HTH domain
MTIGGRIRQIRKKVAGKQRPFAGLFGVSVTSVSSWENDEYRPDLETLAKIASLGDVTLDWLIVGRPSPEKEITIEDAIIRAIKSEPEVATRIGRELIGETEDQYLKQSNSDRFSQDELELIEAYRLADDKIRRYAKRMLEEDAQESRRNAGVGSDSGAENCA